MSDLSLNPDTQEGSQKLCELSTSLAEDEIRHVLTTANPLNPWGKNTLEHFIRKEELTPDQVSTLIHQLNPRALAHYNLLKLAMDHYTLRKPDIDFLVDAIDVSCINGLKTIVLLGRHDALSDGACENLVERLDPTQAQHASVLQELFEQGVLQGHALERAREKGFTEGDQPCLSDKTPSSVQMRSEAHFALPEGSSLIDAPAPHEAPGWVGHHNSTTPQAPPSRLRGTRVFGD